MTSREALHTRAKKAHARLQRARRDPRYLRAVGRFVAEGLLATNDPLVVAHDDPVVLDDVLWAGDHEPRLLELLPAVVIARPDMLATPLELPADLAAAVHALREGAEPPTFRGIPGQAYARRQRDLGRAKAASRLKSFRFRPDDLERLRRLRRELAAPSETEVLRVALRVLERTVDGERRR